jgi:hypothetical protein
MDRETRPKSSGSERIPPRQPATGPVLLASAELAPTVSEFRYIATGDVASSDSRPILRPALPVGLLQEDGRRVAIADALVDSGADHTTLSAEWAKLLGIDLYGDCTEMEVGVADDRPSVRYCYTDGLTIDVAGEPMFLPVVMFCEGLPITLLGRRDFFDRYLVLVDHRNLRFFLERLLDHQEDEDDDPELKRELVFD